MKKPFLSIALGIVVILGAFGTWQAVTPPSISSGDLPKKAFAKEQIQLPDDVASTSNMMKLAGQPDEKVRTFTEVHRPDPQQPTKGDFLQVADHFIDQAVQTADDQYQVKGFESKQQLIDHLGQYASSDIATYYVDGLYQEKNGNLYIIPTELPPWIIMGEPSELKKENEKMYTLVQTNKTDLYGTYKIEISFEQHDGKWKIDDVEYTYN